MGIGNATAVGGTVTAIAGMTVGNWNYTRMSPYGETIASLDDTHLGSADFEERVPGDLKIAKQQEISVQWNYEEDFPSVGTVGTLTVGLPPQGATTPGSITGTGFIVDSSAPEGNTTDRAIGTIVWEWDGKTGPTYSKNT